MNKIKSGLDEALKVAQGDPATIANIKVTTHRVLPETPANVPMPKVMPTLGSKYPTPSCGCVFCDLKCSLFYDEDGQYFYHDGPEDSRIRCDVSNTIGDET